MSPKRILAAVLCASVFAAGPGFTQVQGGSVTGAPAPQAPPAAAGADAEPAPPKLVFTYPCAFAFADGKPYETRVMDWECDFIHASVKGGNKAFNELPTLAAQKAFLEDVIERADDAHNGYIKKIAELIKKTDPDQVPKTLPTAKRMERIAALNVQLSTGVFAAAKPFLWPERADQSYVEKTAGSWPPSWKPYIQPIYDRSGQLSGLVFESEMKIIDKAAADMDRKIAAATAAAAKVKGPAGGVALNQMFDAETARAALAVPVPAPAPAPGPDGAPAAPPVKAQVGQPLPPVSDLKAAPPPIPQDQDERTQRNYFSRGTEAALQRLKDDGQIAVWHVLGQSVTVGDPHGKSGLNFHQEGESCDVSAQAQALRARGQTVDIEALAKEGVAKGYYVDYALSSGRREGGTPWDHLDSLLKDHGVASTSVKHATPEQLDRAIRSSGDAIVIVRVKTFWKDPEMPEGASHAVYVTGMEVGRDGKALGYYVNDTGTGEAARFVPAPVFQKSWMNRFVSLPPASK